MDFSLIGRAKPYIAANLKKDFALFCKAAWPILHAGTRLSWTTGHDAICDYLMAVREKKLTRLIINCPPRFAKSSIVTILFPIWCWLQDPTRSFLCCSYELDLALNHNLDRRRVMESKWFRDLFGDAFELATDRSQAQEFSTTAGGIMQAASTASKAQGRGGDLILVDDPISADFVYSDSYRNEVNFWFSRQLPQRLNNPSESAIIVVAQRLHENDPCGFLLSQEETEWTLLKLALIAEQDETIVFPHSGRVWKRKKGDCLDSKRWSPRTVRERQRNRLVWSSQFQQEPTPAEGNLIRVDEILYFGGRDPQTGIPDPALPDHFERRVISVDCSFKDRASSDYVALIVVGVLGSRRYILHVTNAHLDLTGTENEIRNARATFGPVSAVLIEDKANGSAVISHLKEEIPGVVAVNPEGGKIARVVAMTPEFQAHNWIIERTGPWTHKVVEQLTTFPAGKNDDIVDAISQCSIWLQSNTYGLGLIEGLKTRGRDWLEGKFKNDKAAAAFAEQKPQVTQVDGFAVWLRTHRAPKCRACGNASTNYISRTRYRCNQCGAISDDATGQVTAPPQENLIIGVNCCGDAKANVGAGNKPLVQTVANEVRCGFCGRQAHATTVVTCGISRRDYAAGVGRRRMF
jgi:predicted phage terminase large subunit-like protein